MKAQKLRIAQIVSPWIAVPPKDYGGTERVVFDLTETFITDGHSVTLFASGDSHTHAPLHYVWKKSLTRSNISWDKYEMAQVHMEKSFAKAIKPLGGSGKKPTYKYDIIHFHLSSNSDLVAFELASKSPIPVICTLHSRFPFDRRKGHLAERDAYYLQWWKSLPLVAISKQAREDARKSAIGDLRFMKIISHGLSESDFIKDTDTERNNLVWVGRIVPDKGTHIVLEVAIKLGIPLRFGGIVDKHVPEAVEYFNGVIRPLLKKHKDLLTFVGKVTSKERARLLSSGLIFLNPMQWDEPFGLVMIEAMAQGCPVIAFNRGAAMEIVKSGVSGVLVDTADEMAEKVSEIIETIDRKALVAWAHEHYSIQEVADKYIKAYGQAIRAYKKEKRDLKKKKVGTY